MIHPSRLDSANLIFASTKLINKYKYKGKIFYNIDQQWHVSYQKEILRLLISVLISSLFFSWFVLEVVTW